MKIVKTIISFVVALSLSACMAGLNSLGEEGSNIGSGGGGDDGGGSNTYLTFTGQSFPADGTGNIVLNYNAIGIVVPDGITIDESSVTSDTFILSGSDELSPAISPATIVSGSFDHSYEFECETGPCTGLALIPSTNLSANTEYTVRLVSGENGIRGASGELLEEDIVWSFTTPDLYFMESYPNSKFNAAVALPNGRTLVTGFRNFMGEIDPWLISMEEDGSVYTQLIDDFGVGGDDGNITATTMLDGMLYVAGWRGNQPLESAGGDIWVGAYDPDTLEIIVRISVTDASRTLRPTGILAIDGHLYVVGGGKSGANYEAFIYDFSLENLSLTTEFHFNPVPAQMIYFSDIVPYGDSLLVMGWGRAIGSDDEAFVLKMDPDDEFNILDSHTATYIADSNGRLYMSMKLHDGLIYLAGSEKDDADNIYGLLAKLDPSNMEIIQEQTVFDIATDDYPWQGLYGMTITDDGIIYVAGSKWLSGTMAAKDIVARGFVGMYTTGLVELDTYSFPYESYPVVERMAIDGSGCVRLLGFTANPPPDANYQPFQLKLDLNLNAWNKDLLVF